MNRKKLTIDALRVESFATVAQIEPLQPATDDGDDSRRMGSCVSACGLCPSIDYC